MRTSSAYEALYAAMVAAGRAGDLPGFKAAAEGVVLQLTQLEFVLSEQQARQAMAALVRSEGECAELLGKWSVVAYRAAPAD